MSQIESQDLVTDVTTMPETNTVPFPFTVSAIRKTSTTLSIDVDNITTETVDGTWNFVRLFVTDSTNGSQVGGSSIDTAEIISDAGGKWTVDIDGLVPHRLYHIHTLAGVLDWG